MHTKQEKMEAFGRLLDVQENLRKKCPWDSKQTNESLRSNTIEEVYELSSALMKADADNIREELGDILEHVIFYAIMGDEKGQFDIADVCNKEADKLIFRHPNIYGNMDGVKTEEQMLQTWEQVKQKEREGKKKEEGVLSGVPEALPTLIKAYRIQDKARNVGFDWQKREDVWQKVHEELNELEAELAKDNKENSTKELGDFLFSVINAARLYHINPDNALEQTNQKFTKRFNYIEQKAKEMGKALKNMALDEMDKFWNEAKKIAPIMLLGIICLTGCKQKATPVAQVQQAEPKTVNDSTIYGTIGEATAMHTLQLITSKNDSLQFMINDDDQLVASDVQGGLLVGDRVAVVATTVDGERVAQKVINLTTLVGHWTSIDKNFKIEEDGQVVSSINPEKHPWTSWHILNGHLLLNADTFDIVQLGADSLALENKDGIFVYKR